jgi:AcrR family transcriptional regulator
LLEQDLSVILTRVSSGTKNNRMARIDRARRAEIGQEKRARTRSKIVAAASSLFAQRAVESVTVDDVVAKAGVAKGTFYVHFDDLAALTAAVADELIGTLDELLQPQRLSISDPLTRIAFGCNSFIEKALDDPAWANMVARMARSHPAVGQVARSRLREDLAQALEEMPRQAPSLVLALEVALGVILQALAAFGERRLISKDREAAIACVLRAIGADARRVRSTLAQLPRVVLTEGAGHPAVRPAAATTARARRRRARVDAV